MTLVDTGPIVALFDPGDSEHLRCRQVLESIRDPLLTTLPVLTESFHLLRPSSLGCRRLGEFLDRGGLGVWPLDDAAVKRCLALMEQYRDRPMDLADASLVAAAEEVRTARIFSLDRTDFSIYRWRLGLRPMAFDILS